MNYSPKLTTIMENTETKKNERPVELYKQAYDYASRFDHVDRLDVIKAYMAGHDKANKQNGLLNVSGAQPVAGFVPAVLKETGEQPYLSIAYDEADMAYGVRIIGLGENFVVALHDAKDGKEVTWEEACKLKAPTKKQAALMFAVWDELNAMLQEAGGDRLDDGNWRWTSTECTGYSAWYYTGAYGRLNYGSKDYSSTVRPVLA